MGKEGKQLVLGVNVELITQAGYNNTTTWEIAQCHCAARIKSMGSTQQHQACCLQRDREQSSKQFSEPDNSPAAHKLQTHRSHSDGELLAVYTIHFTATHMRTHAHTHTPPNATFKS